MMLRAISGFGSNQLTHVEEGSGQKALFESPPSRVVLAICENTQWFANKIIFCPCFGAKMAHFQAFLGLSEEHNDSPQAQNRIKYGLGADLEESILFATGTLCDPQLALATLGPGYALAAQATTG